MGEEIRFRCPVAARGGCQMEKMSYAQQLAAKQDWVRDLLRPYCRVDRILGMENPFHYRNKTHAVIASDKRGNVISGVYRMGTHQVVPVDDCLIENEKADEIIRTIRSMLASFKIRPYREDTRSGLIRHVLVRTGHQRPDHGGACCSAANTAAQKRFRGGSYFAVIPKSPR